MASVCSIYELLLKTLAEEHKLCPVEDMSDKGSLVLVELLYDVRRDQNDEHADYDVFVLSDKRDMLKA